MHGAWLRRRRQGGAPMSLLPGACGPARHVHPCVCMEGRWRLRVTPGLGGTYLPLRAANGTGLGPLTPLLGLSPFRR